MKGIIRTVIVDLMRHGDKNGDYVSPFGFSQVAATVRKHLTHVQLDTTCHSDMNRARESVVHALEVLGQAGVSMTPHEAFFVGHLFEGDLLKEIIALDEEIGKTGTAADWLNRWSLGPRIRERIIAGMVDIANELVVYDPDLDHAHVLVGFHDPLCGLAAVRPEEIGPLGTADIVRYTLTNDGSGWVIVSSVHLRCPLVKIAE